MEQNRIDSFAFFVAKNITSILLILAMIGVSMVVLLTINTEFNNPCEDLTGCKKLKCEADSSGGTVWYKQNRLLEYQNCLLERNGGII